MKVFLAVITVLAGLFAAYIASAIFALAIALVLSFLLDPFLSIIDIPFLTERLAGLGAGKLFILVFTFRLIVGCLIPIRTTTTNSGGGK
jgi:hypothetical protein